MDTLTIFLHRGEGERLVAEMEKLCGVAAAAGTHAGRRALAAYIDCIRTLPPSMVPSFEAQLRHKDGAVFPVTLHISALRDASGDAYGAGGGGRGPKRDPAPGASAARVPGALPRLFENSSEMIATLSPAGQFLYANPAWKRCFGMDTAALLALDSFEDFRAELPRRSGRAVPPRAGWRSGGPRAAAPPHSRRPRAGVGAEPEPAAKGRQSARGALPAARYYPAEAAGTPAGAATGGEPDRGRKRLTRGRRHAHP